MPLVPGTEGHPPWLQLVGAIAFVVAMGVLAAVSNWRGKQQGEKEARGERDTATRQASAVVALQPSASRYTEDVLVQTLVSLKMSVDKLVDLLERQEREREEDERDELRELRRWKDELERGRR